MATVKDTATGDVYEGVTGSLLAYYRGEGDRFVITEDAAEVSLPVVHQQDGTVTVGADQTVQGTGEPNVGYAVPEGATSATLDTTTVPATATAEVGGETVQLQPEQTTTQTTTQTTPEVQP